MVWQLWTESSTLRDREVDSGDLFAQVPEPLGGGWIGGGRIDRNFSRGSPVLTQRTGSYKRASRDRGVSKCA